MFYRFIQLAFAPFARFWFRLEVRGAAPASGAYILAANHVSWLDPAVLGSACRRPIRFVITRRIYDDPKQRWFYRGMRTIPVRDSGDPDLGAMRDALRALRQGELVGIFPEGAGLDPEGRLRAARPGVALLAQRARVPVVPVAIEGTHASLPKGGRFPRPGRIRVTFGEPFLLHAARETGDRRAGSGEAEAGGERTGAPGESAVDERQALADEMMRRIAGLLRP